MSDYNAPVQDMKFVLETLCDMDGLRGFPAFAETSSDLVEQILNESARFTGDCLLYTSPSPRDQRGSRMPSSA